MKNGKILFTVGFFLISMVAFSQDYAFKVLANKGTNEVKSGDAWQSVKTGVSLKPGDELKVSENSYLGLVHSSGKPLEVKQAGNYKVADLAAKVGTGASVLNKYTDFILSSNSAESKKNRLSATGAVHRGLEDIKVFLPENQYAEVYNNTAIINWQASKGGPYVVTLKNMFDDELQKFETPETSLQIDLNDPKFAKESAILVEVTSKGEAKGKSEQHLIKRLSPARYDAVKKSLGEISVDVKDETALNKLILAGFYEENKLYIDAITSYEQAIKLAPDVPTYKDAYEEFLLRNKLKLPK
jgi:hypothetical protein